MNNVLFGTIGGDVAGSVYESRRNSTKCYGDVNIYHPLRKFTDDTVCTIAIAEALLTGEPFADSLQRWCRKYPHAGYGHKFRDWIYNPVPYGSFGNGSGMRVSPVAFFAETEEQVLDLAKQSAECSHNHPEGIRGAQTIALCIYRALRADSKLPIREVLTTYYPDHQTRTLNDVRPRYHFDSSCQGSVPVAILAFLESEDYEDCLKLAISMGGDADTLAAMAGGIAYAYYKQMPQQCVESIKQLLPPEMLTVCEKFDVKLK